MAENLEVRGDKYYYRGIIGKKLRRKSMGIAVGVGREQKKKNRELALRRANEIEYDLRNGGLGYATVDMPEWGVWSNQWLEGKGETEHTMMQRNIREWHDQLLNEITPIIVQRYFAKRAAGYADKGTRQLATPPKKASLERERILIHGCFEAAVTNGLIKTNPCQQAMYKGDVRGRVMTVAEEAALRTVLPPLWQRYLTVALGTGLRSKEQRYSHPDDIADRTLQVRGENNKTGKPRLIPLSAAAQHALTEQQAECKVAHNGNLWDYSKTNVLDVLVRAHDKANLKLPHITVHDLRRTFATRAARGGMSVKVLQGILGHEKIETTMKIYVHLDENDARSEIDKLFPPSPTA